MKIIKISYVLLVITCASCDKTFLEEKPDKSLLVPQTLADFQAILDYHTFMNRVPYMPLISADDYRITDDAIAARSVLERNSYLWSPELYESGIVGDWNNQYLQVFYANIVLDGLENMDVSAAERQNRDILKGSALFYRGLAHYNLVQQFAKPYVFGAATKELGVPIRMFSDVNKLVGRGNLADSYEKIIEDLKTSVDLLPENVVFTTRPTRQAAFALLARIFLGMGEYEAAERYAKDALAINDSLIDYNSLVADSLSAARPFPDLHNDGNVEVIFYTPIASTGYLNAITTVVDSALLNTYNKDDLRKSVFFVKRANGAVNFKGSYSGRALVTTFAGLAIDELYLIYAECLVRRNQLIGAADIMDGLLIKRWKIGEYHRFFVDDSSRMLRYVLEERRKQLFSRGLRWFDLRRLNLDPTLSVDLSRNVRGVEYKLPAGDKRYTFPIPDIEIDLNGLEQNPR